MFHLHVYISLHCIPVSLCLHLWANMLHQSVLHTPLSKWRSPYVGTLVQQGLCSSGVTRGRCGINGRFMWCRSCSLACMRKQVLPFSQSTSGLTLAFCHNGGSLFTGNIGNIAPIVPRPFHTASIVSEIVVHNVRVHLSNTLILCIFNCNYNPISCFISCPLSYRCLYTPF